MAGGAEGGRGGARGSRLFYVGANFCHQQNISVVIPFISDHGTPACTRSFHICFLLTCDVTPFGFASFPLFTTRTDGPEVTTPISLKVFARVPTLPVAFVTAGIIMGFSEAGAPLKSCTLILLVTATLSGLNPVINA